MTYASTAVRADGGNRWLVDGELTIHGVTRSVPLEVTFEGAGGDPWGGVRAGFSARAEIDREDFGLTWNQVLETGGIAVGKKVTIDLEVEAVLQA
jgi:polyisoprenoid-binding protein YceI